MQTIVFIRVVFFCCVLTFGTIILLQHWPLNIMARPSPVKHNVPLFNHLAHTDPRKCGRSDACPPEHFAFRIRSGVANAIGPNICFENEIVMSDAIMNTKNGINIAVIDGLEGKILKTEAFLMWSKSSEEKKLYNFLQSIEEGMLVLLASYDEPASKMTPDIKDYFRRLGSSAVDSLKFRDSWVFVGTLGMSGKSPFEKHLPNKSKTNKYDLWPGVVELDGCIPRRPAQGYSRRI